MWVCYFIIVYALVLNIAIAIAEELSNNILLLLMSPITEITSTNSRFFSADEGKFWEIERCIPEDVPNYIPIDKYMI